MNREIRFRGKRKSDNQWIYGYYVNTHDRPRIIYEDYEGYYMEEEVIPESVGQYTGMNNKEIYEGDLYKDEENMLWEVVYHGTYTGAFILVNTDVPARLLLTAINEMKAAGNRFDNPELLEDK